MKKYNSLKLITDVEFIVGKNSDDLDDHQTFYTRSRVHSALSMEELHNVIQKMIDDITVDVEVKALKGSGFTIVGINSINIYIGKYDPSRGGSYIPLPMWISHKKLVLI
jgi:hypothetical protein